MTDGPHHGQSPTGPAARAADPNTPQVQLQMLAGDHPELRPLIAENPNTYPELLQWLGALGDPAVDAALVRRSAGADEFSAVREDHPQSYDQSNDQGHARSHAQAQPRPGYYPAAPTGPAPWEASAAPLSYADHEPEPRRRGGGTCAIILLILLVAAAAVVAAYFLIFNGVFSGDEDPADETSISEEQTDQGPDTGEEGAQDSDEGTQDDDAEADGTEDDDAADDDAQAARPAPEGAQDIPAFTAPSGNINCAIGEDELECNILDYSFDTPQGCDGPARLSVGSEDPQLDCGSTEGANSATLQYGQSASNGRFACVSSEAAFECWNTETGNGFTLSREGYQLQN
ncbi:variant leucine-rich repeat-containing protein [Nesterenkonia sp. DZ6]|uniref:variant leucine-rich repeat-containing protein n=1 Tax=Nesterenkonia sp. DZ6 TaxID=2901229 RepID=UPI001F4CA6B2|nr:hypothetical protein [Nesterenkonia sp. DZ6]MCH8559845.1 hypothetical protein [Nesterenkonia sp. DZ6]